MKQFTSVKDIAALDAMVSLARELKSDPFSFKATGENKTLGLVFMNPSLRTRLSTQKAAANLGMNVMVLHINQESWNLELQDGAVMNGMSVEHIKDAAAVMGLYCDMIGIRCFPGLQSRKEDDDEHILNQFIRYCNCPVISLESATLHPLQSFADTITIAENTYTNKHPKVVLTWAPHIKPLPQAVANSFAEWMLRADTDFVITHPEGYELNKKFTANAPVIYDQEEALRDADFVYVKNWSSYTDYGRMPEVKKNWLLSEEKMQLTNHAFLMHCLPVRRNVEVPDILLDHERSLILQQAQNRVYAAQAVLKTIIDANF